MATRLRKDFFEINGQKSFAKFKMDPANIEKILISLVEYDKEQTSGSKVVAQSNCYLGFDEAKLLAHDILSGKIAKMAANELKKGEKYPQPVWTSMGGTNEQKCAEKQLRTDGKALSRVLSICPGSTYPFVLKVEQGAGESNDKGLIVPKFGTKPEVRIFVPIDDATLKKLAIMINTHIDAFITSQYARGAYEEEYTDKRPM